MTIQTLSDEQRAFVEAIRDFARRECGTREQRDALTDHGHEPHNQELYERIADLGCHVFIDDLPANINGARAVGFHGIVYRPGENLAGQLQRLGVLV